MDEAREASWSGSERSRRPQGTCEPPKLPPCKDPRFLVRAGTECAIKAVSASAEEWQTWTTRRHLGFERFERWVKSETGNFYEFRDQGWLILVASRKVLQRKDGRTSR